jgi:hypothetical protein
MKASKPSSCWRVIASCSGLVGWSKSVPVEKLGSSEGSAQTAKAVARSAVCTVIQNEAIPSSSGKVIVPSFSISSALSAPIRQLPTYSRTRHSGFYSFEFHLL